MTSAKHRFVTTLALAGALALGLAACGSSGSGKASSTGSSGSGSSGKSATLKTGPGIDTAGKTITIGDITALSGAASVIGKPLEAGYKAYWAYVNANGGVGGWKVNINTVDDAYDPQKHVQAYNQIVNGIAMLGTSFGSPTTSAIESQAQAASLLVGTVAQDSAFVNSSVNLVIDSPYAVDVANSLYYLIKTKGVSNPKVAIFYQNDAYGQDGLKGYNAAKALGFQDVGQATYNVTDSSFTAQATQLKNSGAQYVVVTAIPTAAAGLLATAASIGYTPQWILQGPAFATVLMTSDGGPSGTPTPLSKVFSGAWLMGDEAAWGDNTVPGMAQFLSIQKQQNPTQNPNGYYVYGYCMAEVQAAILKKAVANNDLSRAGIVSAKQHLGSFSWGGLMPDASYTPANGPATRQTSLFQIDPTAPGFVKNISNGFFMSPQAQSMSFASGSSS